VKLSPERGCTEASKEVMEASEERANAMRSGGAAAVDAGVVSVDRYEVGYLIQP
jgi:hypothetical protein